VSRGRIVQPSFLCDTSVLVAASDVDHPDYGPSIALVRTADPDHAFCAAHTLAELYSTLSAMPRPRMRRTSEVLANVEHAAKVFTPVSLDTSDYRWVLAHAAKNELRSGQVFDALILKAAERAGVDIVYTWNIAHFARVAWSAVADRIRQPVSQPK
jgi:predicted nucleic acid-binding protein